VNLNCKKYDIIKKGVFMYKKAVFLIFILSFYSSLFATVLPTDYNVGDTLPASDLNQMLAERSEDLIPISASRNYIDANEDLGSNSYNWKDLYLAGTANATTVDFGTNTISDGNLIGNWDFNTGYVTEIASITLNHGTRSTITYPNLFAAKTVANTLSNGQSSGSLEFYTDVTDLSSGTLALDLDGITANMTVIDLGANTIYDGNMTGNWDLNSFALSGITDIEMNGTIDIGTNTIYDGNFTGNWDYNNSDVTNISNITLNHGTRSTILFPGLFAAPQPAGTDSNGQKIMFYENASQKYGMGLGSSADVWFQTSGYYSFYGDTDNTTAGKEIFKINDGTITQYYDSGDLSYTYNNDSHGDNVFLSFNAEDAGGTNRLCLQTWDPDEIRLNFILPSITAYIDNTSLEFTLINSAGSGDLAVKIDNDSHGDNSIIQYTAEDSGGTNRTFTQTWDSDNRIMNFNSDMYIDEANSRVGIGTSNPSYQFHNEGNETTFLAKIKNNNASGDGLNVESLSNSGADVLFSTTSGIGGLVSSHYADGAIRFPFVYGTTVTAGGPRTTYIDSSGYIGGISSIRESKTNIADFDAAFIYDLKPKTFNYRKKDVSGNYTSDYESDLEYGLIAEDTASINRHLVFYKDEKLKGIHYRKLTSVLVKVVQEQKKELLKLNERLLKLENQQRIINYFFYHGQSIISFLYLIK
jgi:hypothetical protein